MFAHLSHTFIKLNDRLTRLMNQVDQRRNGNSHARNSTRAQPHLPNGKVKWNAEMGENGIGVGIAIEIEMVMVCREKNHHAIFDVISIYLL